MINYIYLFLSSAFDVIDEADIKFHYHPGNESRHPPEVRRRHRRYLANVLSELLHDIDWKANFSTTVPWNYDLDSKTSGPSFKVRTLETDNLFICMIKMNFFFSKYMFL
jgi:hypothetical protein